MMTAATARPLIRSPIRAARRAHPRPPLRTPASSSSGGGGPRRPSAEPGRESSRAERRLEHRLGEILVRTRLARRCGSNIALLRRVRSNIRGSSMRSIAASCGTLPLERCAPAAPLVEQSAARTARIAAGRCGRTRTLEVGSSADDAAAILGLGVGERAAIARAGRRRDGACGEGLAAAVRPAAAGRRGRPRTRRSGAAGDGDDGDRGLRAASCDAAAQSLARGCAGGLT